jgi:hypothetical protein
MYGRGMTLDESVCTDLVTSNPTRFLPKQEGNGEPHPNGPGPLVSGGGMKPVKYCTFLNAKSIIRRICSGRYLADANLWIVMASVLATMNISKAIDTDGKEITPMPAFTSGITR